MAARDTILDAAESVMRTKGIARATTKEIAREAGYSEALLYKHFADKQEIYMAVMRERSGAVTNPDEYVGRDSVADNLVELTLGLMAFYVVSFPISASLFSDTALLVGWRDAMIARGGGPRIPLRALEGYLEAEQSLGRVPADVDVRRAAALLCGAAFQHAVFAAFDGLDAVPNADDLAADWVAELGFSSR